MVVYKTGDHRSTIEFDDPRRGSGQGADLFVAAQGEDSAIGDGDCFCDRKIIVDSQYYAVQKYQVRLYLLSWQHACHRKHNEQSQGLK